MDNIDVLAIECVLKIGFCPLGTYEAIKYTNRSNIPSTKQYHYKFKEYLSREVEA